MQTPASTKRLVGAICAALTLAIAACDSHVGRIAGINGPTTGSGTGSGTGGTGADTTTAATISVSPASLTMTVGTTQAFSATARNASGTTVSPTIQWSSSNTGVA